MKYLSSEELLPRVLLMGAICLSSGCQPDHSAASDGLSVQVSASSGHFEVIDRMTLESTEAHVVARVSDADHGPSGELFIADHSEGNVKKFAPDGQLIAVYGRKGSGPGEFQVPRIAVTNSTVSVIDTRLQRMVRFRHDGTLIDHVPLSRFAWITDLVALPNGNYLIAGQLMGDDGGRVLHRWNPEAEVLQSYLALAQVRPTGQPENPVWSSFRVFYTTLLDEERAVVVSAISDSVWTVNLDSGRESRIRLQVPGMEYPDLRTGEPTNVQEMVAFSKSFHSARKPVVHDGLLIIPFVQGSLADTDSVLAVVHDGVEWEVIRDGPRLIAATDTGFLALDGPGGYEARVASLSFVK